ncbi:MAG: AAA family ATPase [Lachnospiraceae bacterium]|nr:AAA family ATPase [Lachnospiraceae bacterium]
MNYFDKVIGYADIKAELIRFCDVLKNLDRYKKLGVTLPRGILLCGEPGIGKTLMANCFIQESGCKAYLIRKDKPDGDFVNEICNVFENAKKESNVIVFLDDLDKFANEDQYHKDAEEYVAVQSCIDDCKNSGVFVLATANDRDCLPSSLTRAGRFDKVIEMQSPEGEDSKRIIEYYLSQKQVLGDIDAEEISRLMKGHSCAELEMVINEAGIYAGYDQREKIEQKDILKACMRMIFASPETIEENNSSYLRNIAIHEAGHVVVSEILEPGSVSLVSVCRYSGAREGVSVIQRPENFNISHRAQENEVMIKLGGKAATEVVYGLVDLGCSSDIHRAYSIIAQVVENCCLYGFDTIAGSKFTTSGYVLEKKDRTIAQEMERYYRQAKQIIAENRELLDTLTRELMEKKTLTYREIKIIREKVSR